MDDNEAIYIPYVTMHCEIDVISNDNHKRTLKNSVAWSFD